MDTKNLLTERQLSNKEVLNYYYNLFNDRLIQNFIDLNHYRHVKKVLPDYKQGNERGQEIGIEKIIQNHLSKIRFARRNVAYLEKLIEIEANGKLPSMWTDEMLDMANDQEESEEKNEGND